MTTLANNQSRSGISRSVRGLYLRHDLLIDCEVLKPRATDLAAGITLEVVVLYVGDDQSRAFLVQGAGRQWRRGDVDVADADAPLLVSTYPESNKKGENLSVHPKLTSHHLGSGPSWRQHTQTLGLVLIQLCLDGNTPKSSRPSSALSMSSTGGCGAGSATSASGSLAAVGVFFVLGAMMRENIPPNNRTLGENRLSNRLMEVNGALWLLLFSRSIQWLVVVFEQSPSSGQNEQPMAQAYW